MIVILKNNKITEMHPLTKYWSLCFSVFLCEMLFHELCVLHRKLSQKILQTLFAIHRGHGYSMQYVIQHLVIFRI